MRNRQKGFILVFGFVGVICFIYYSFFSSTAILNHVKQYKGYNLQIVQEKYPIELFIEPEWFSLEKEQTQKVNKVVYEKNHTKIILRSVILREDQLMFDFTTDYDLPYLKGDFLYNGIFNPDGTYTTSPNMVEFELTNPMQQPIVVGQRGSGPDSDFIFNIEKEQWQQIEQGFTMRYFGMYLYEYEKK